MSQVRNHIYRMILVWPATENLAGYVHALEHGWSPDNLRLEAAQEHLDRIAADPARFLAEQIDRDAKGPKINLPDGRVVSRLPGYTKWMWDGEFCGAINFRWQPGTSELPPYCLGHIGYAVVPWKQRRGYATRALQLMLPHATEEGLRYIEIVTDVQNTASQKVIEANGGKLIDRFEAYGAERLRYRISLQN